MRHVILGGCGFIGRHVALALLRRGETVVLAGRAPPIEPPPDVDPSLVSFVPFDLATHDWGGLLRDGDVVHHYAWSTVPKTANESPLADLDVNLRGTLRLLEALRRRQGTRLVFSSSGGTVYGHLRRTPVDEEHPLDPVTAYGVSKVAAEKYLGFYRGIHGLDCRIARISNPYGVGQDAQRKQGAASIFLQRALAGEAIEVWGDGAVVRDYIHVVDVAAGLLALADAPPERLGAEPVFNIGSGEGVSINAMLALLRHRLGRPLDVRYLPGRTFDVPVSVLDVARARTVLGWRAGLDLAAGIERVMTDYREASALFSSLSVPTSCIRPPAKPAQPARRKNMIG